MSPQTLLVERLIMIMWFLALTQGQFIISSSSSLQLSSSTVSIHSSVIGISLLLCALIISCSFTRLFPKFSTTQQFHQVHSFSTAFSAFCTAAATALVTMSGSPSATRAPAGHHPVSPLKTAESSTDNVSHHPVLPAATAERYHLTT